LRLLVHVVGHVYNLSLVMHWGRYLWWRGHGRFRCGGCFVGGGLLLF
jgi:hypothetical protein